ncbi:MAG TPA: ABC transporter permease [Cyclobacteriaceae bacterium]|nr:ABC transporter permease [Cyclobacteriaceae bacterium]HMV09435.1 ABC transporter permease [Cyclobacteriaceae bacterium]HMV89477.1 ABC transporter permease [Cyclobacteriaceae bacterium]HMX02456.1 ABC transporter permease [Cyclobacteriaceae bacterium]HMX51056.1 ABC transporter permease [Cyclobacteriaceae bacterium]
MKNYPPKFFLRFFRWYCHPEMVGHIEGDIMELYAERLRNTGKRKADVKFIIDVVLLCRPGIIRPVTIERNVNQYAMVKSYFKVGWRNMLRNKGYSAINISGLAIGMAVALLIGLWVFDELTFDTHFKNYDRIVQVMQHQTYNGEIGTQVSNPAVMGEEIRNVYGSDFKHVLQSSWNFDHILTYGDKIFAKPGSYFEPGVVDMLSLNILRGTADGLKEMNSIMLSKSVAKTLFGDEDPINKMLRLDNAVDVKVTAVYEDIPVNTTFRDLTIIMPWTLYLSQNTWVQKMTDPWDSNFTQTFAQLNDNADLETVSTRIKDVKINRQTEEEKRYKAVVFLHPMSKWHLYSDFKQGVNIGGQIDNVWLFSITGIFVLLLACINFMNLSTARSEKRSKEVGIRKSIGSVRSQLITQFFSESVLIAFLAFVLAIGLGFLALPAFNSVAGKQIVIPWNTPMFWMIGIGFTLITGIFAGLYPALFLSSFQPVKVLKGSFKLGRMASLPRQVLVTIQFTISIVLIIGTIVVYKQIQYAQGRPMGYAVDGLITTGVNSERHKHFEAIRNELKSSNAIVDMAESGSPITDVWNTNGGFDWEGKDPNLAVDFPNNGVTYEYGKTIGWQISEGRDFSRDYASDSSAFILNESAVKFIGLTDPIGKVIKWNNENYTVIGVVKDILVQSPYAPVRPAMWHLTDDSENVFIIKLNPDRNAQESMAKVEEVFKKLDTTSPFSASFVDEDFSNKFGNEKRIGTLAAFFAGLAVFISCLGLFGLASFVAEQRTKEIGIRKVMGASVQNLWQLLSKDFVILVIISSVVAIAFSYFFFTHWLESYEYRTSVSWWIFAASAAGALVITLITVSFQAIKAATNNPIKSLRSE